MRFLPLLIRLCFVFGLFLTISCGSAGNKEEGKNAIVEKDNRPAELKELTRKVLADPGNPQVYVDRAAYYLRQHHSKDAYEDLKQVFTIDSLYANGYVALYDYYIEVSEANNARKALEDGLRKNPRNTNIALKLAELYLIARKHEQSFKYINDALKIDKYLARAYFLKGMNYKELMKRDKAISGFQTAIEQDPDCYEAYMQLGLLYSKERNKLAPQYLSSAIRVQEKNPEAWYARAMFYQEGNELERAKQDYRAILAFDSTYFNAWYNLGYLQYQKDNIDSAYYFFDQGVKKDYTQAKGYYMRALCWEQKGEKAKAISDLEFALKLKEDYPLAEAALQRLK